MKYAVPTMAGSAPRSVRSRIDGCRRSAAALAALLLLAGSLSAQELYKYKDENGDWIYSDRRPVDAADVESRELKKSAAEPVVDVDHRYEDETVILTAQNDFYAPVELRLEFTHVEQLELPGPEHPLTWVVPPRAEVVLLQLPLAEGAVQPVLQYQFRYMPGDPRAKHDPAGSYRAPFAMATDHHITQAYPDAVTHTTPDSYYAVDFAMPIGTDVVAAREGVVFAVASTNFRSGLSVVEDGPAANVVRILHDDGTYAIYAHLNTNSIRVKPGDVVERGEYIADSGNTGYSSGPHLHFAVVQNVGLQVVSVPVTFAGPTAMSIVPASGNVLTAY